jgi:hypothetical protein
MTNLINRSYQQANCLLITSNKRIIKRGKEDKNKGRYLFFKKREIVFLENNQKNKKTGSS